MRPFSTQYILCDEQGMHKAGELKKFKDYPYLLPSPWHKIGRVVMERLKTNPDEGLTPILCLRFGGECSSRHPDCKAMRNLVKEK
jgi:hypothetical protein